MSSLAQRLQMFIDHEGLTPYIMNKAAGLSRGLLFKTLQKDATLTNTNIEKILLTYPNLNADWLITGRGSMLLTEEPPKPSVKQSPLPKELENSIYRQVVWHLLLQDTYQLTHDRLNDILSMLQQSEDRCHQLIEKLTTIKQVIETQYMMQPQDHGIYEMVLRVTANEDGKYTPSQLKEAVEINDRILRYVTLKRKG